MQKRRRFIIAALLFIGIVTLALCLVQSEAHARAGGGRGYGGGGGGFRGGGGGGFRGFGGSSSRSRGRGRSIPLPWQLQLAIFALVVGVGIYSAITESSRRQTRTIRRGLMIRDDRRQSDVLAQVLEADSKFDFAFFEGRVTTAFVKLQTAWCGHDIDSVRAFISDGIFERFTLQVHEQQDLGYRDNMENVQAQHVQLAEFSTDGSFEVVTVRIDASAIDYRVSLDTQKPLTPRGGLESFAEYWTFIRRRGAQFDNKRGLIEGFCPNCGDSIAVNAGTKCQSCDSQLRSGQYDWVLCEITQECEWRNEASQTIPGVEVYRANVDPGFNLHHIEDRASVIFWRKAASDRTGDIAPLAKMATQDFCERYTPRLQADQTTKRYRGDCAVGGVETLGVVRGEQIDKVLVLVRWSGKVFVTKSGQTPKQTSESALFRSVFVLVRQHGITTSVEQSISSSHCPTCGAPESDSASHACDFCGEVLNDGTHDWVLDNLLVMSDAEVQDLLRAARSADVAPSAPVADETNGSTEPRRSELLGWLVMMAVADRKLDEGEKTILKRMAKQNGMKDEGLKTLLEAAVRNELDLPTPNNRDEGRHWLGSMADMSLSDGKLKRSEFELLCKVGDKLKLTEYDVKMIVKKRQTQLLRSAREQIKAAPPKS